MIEKKKKKQNNNIRTTNAKVKLDFDIELMSIQMSERMNERQPSIFCGHLVFLFHSFF